MSSLKAVDEDIAYLTLSNHSNEELFIMLIVCIILFSAYSLYRKILKPKIAAKMQKKGSIQSERKARKRKKRNRKK